MQVDIGVKTAFSFNIFGKTINIAQSIVVQWVVMLILIIIALVLTRNLKKVPGKKQTVVELFVETVNGLVNSNMGSKYKDFVPYVGTLLIFMLVLNLTGLLGVEPSTKDVNVTLAFALMTFFIIQINSIMKVGFGGYLKGYIKPFAAMLPMNIIERFTVPISLCLRLFINMLVGSVVIGLVYQGMGHFAFIVPIPLHAFFDLFDGCIQMFVFLMLTMVNIKITAEH